MSPRRKPSTGTPNGRRPLPSLDAVVEAHTHSPLAARRNLFRLLCEQALSLASESGSVTADDLRFEGLPIDRRIVGAVFAHLVRRKLLTRDAYLTTGTASSHRRPIARFVPVTPQEDAA